MPWMITGTGDMRENSALGTVINAKISVPKWFMLVLLLHMSIVMIRANTRANRQTKLSARAPAVPSNISFNTRTYRFFSSREITLT
ncbi:hypothetical protein PSPO01_07480 [Paraphaeosphaeria sporulosa]